MNLDVKGYYKRQSEVRKGNNHGVPTIFHDNIYDEFDPKAKTRDEVAQLVVDKNNAEDEAAKAKYVGGPTPLP